MEPKKRKRSSSIHGLADDDASNYLCPICFNTVDDPHVTKCGHTFCLVCINTSLKHNKRCLKCSELIDQVFPNFLLNELINKHNKKHKNKMLINRFAIQSPDSIVDKVQKLIDESDGDIGQNEIDVLIDTLASYKKNKESASEMISNELFKMFLTQVRREKELEADSLNQQLSMIDEDLKETEAELVIDPPGEALSTRMRRSNQDHDQDRDLHRDRDPESVLEPSSSCCSSSLNLSQSSKSSSNLNQMYKPSADTMNHRKNKMLVHFKELQSEYLNSRMKSIFDPASKIDHLKHFKTTLNQLTGFNKLRPLSCLSYSFDTSNTSSIVSSIEFDKDSQFLAIAGVTKKIKLYEYQNLISESLKSKSKSSLNNPGSSSDTSINPSSGTSSSSNLCPSSNSGSSVIHWPVTEMECSSKISCLSFSKYQKSMLVSSDYDGVITLWDVFSGQQVSKYQEHEKRCWSVDFNLIDSKIIVSGSDDSKVKLWSIDSKRSLMTLEAKANVCCVKFNPQSQNHLAFGGADHYLRYYDLRSTKIPLNIFRGHKKAVSYVNFLNKHELVSASTDSQLKLWSLIDGQCSRSFKGHVNEKNFVGLSSNSDNLIVCGSENNSLYVYTKGLSQSILNYHFDQSSHKTDKESSQDFVSAVSWKADSNVIVAANSQGIVKVLELV